MSLPVFTGLVETTGRIVTRAQRGSGQRITVQSELGVLELGESISVSGACLTVAAMRGDQFDADVSTETLERTTLGGLGVGSRVNLERAVRLSDRLGGHLVSGHVDGIAAVRETSPAGDALRVRVRAPETLLPFIAPKGSVTLDGVSLTVNALWSQGFELMLIPHTLGVTTLGTIAAGRQLNLEVDLVARYVVHYLRATAGSGAPDESGGLETALRRSGFLNE